MNKIAIYKENIYKVASEKWTKKDKKGFLKNTAINVAQDFVSSGNPFNVGSHIIGSVMDSVAMEGLNMRANKKIQANINKQKQDRIKQGVGVTQSIRTVMPK